MKLAAMAVFNGLYALPFAVNNILVRNYKSAVKTEFIEAAALIVMMSIKILRQTSPLITGDIASPRDLH